MMSGDIRVAANRGVLVAHKVLEMDHELPYVSDKNASSSFH